MKQVQKDLGVQSKVLSHGSGIDSGGIKKIKSDRGGEFMSTAFQQYLAEVGIFHEVSAPYSPEKKDELNATTVSL